MRTLRNLKLILVALLLTPVLLQAVIIQLWQVELVVFVAFVVVVITWAVGRFGPP